MHTLGRHLLLELYGCDTAILDEPATIEALMGVAARAGGATVVETVFHQFAPQGVTGVVVVEESHLSVHTWPEAGYAAVDFFTCGDCDPERAAPVLRDGLGAASSELMILERGRGARTTSIRVAKHVLSAVAPEEKLSRR